MQPNQPPQAPPPVSKGPQKPSNPYDFLQAKPTKQKGPGGPNLPTGSSTGQRLLIFLGIIGFVLVIAIVFVSFIRSAGKESTNDLISVVKQQTEIMRVADIGIDKSNDSATRSLALTAKYSLQSDQPDLVNAIKAAGTKVTDKILQSGLNPATDTTLNQAEQNNRFDDAFKQELNKELSNYQLTLKKAYQNAKGKKLKDSLKVDFDHINLIVGQTAQ
jgi:flagellar basal body-associated protein FliL